MTPTPESDKLQRRPFEKLSPEERKRVLDRVERQIEAGTVQLEGTDPRLPWKRLQHSASSKVQSEEKHLNAVLQRFLSTGGDAPYRKLIQHHIRRQNLEQLMEGAVSESRLLPADLQLRVASFVDLLNVELLTSSQFWLKSSCRDAVNVVSRIANKHFGLVVQLPVETASMSEGDQERTFGLFQIATLTFASSASFQPKLRKLMGIRYGLFRR